MVLKRKVLSLGTRIRNVFGRPTFARRLGRGSIFTSLKQRWVQVAYILALLLLTAGIVNAGVNGEPNTVPILQSRDVQNVLETIIYLLVYGIGAIGAYVLYLSGRQTVRARSSGLYFAFGIILLLIALWIEYYILVYIK
jgi:hypothetical protein